MRPRPSQMPPFATRLFNPPDPDAGQHWNTSEARSETGLSLTIEWPDTPQRRLGRPRTQGNRVLKVVLPRAPIMRAECARTEGALERLMALGPRAFSAQCTPGRLLVVVLPRAPIMRAECARTEDLLHTDFARGHRSCPT